MLPQFGVTRTGRTGAVYQESVMKQESQKKEQPDRHPNLDLARLHFFEEQRGNGGVLNHHFWGDAAPQSASSQGEERPAADGPDAGSVGESPNPLPE